MIVLALVLLISGYADAFRTHPLANYVVDPDDLAFPLKSYSGVSAVGYRASASDSEKVVFEDGGNLYIAQPGNIYNYRFLTKGSHPSWSPDGEWILFHRDSAIWRIKPSGENEEKLSNSRYAETQPSWSFDGTKIVFKRIISPNREQLVVADPDMKNLKIVVDIPAYAHYPKFFPDGKRIIFGSNLMNEPSMLIDDMPNSDLWYVDIEEGTMHRLTTNGGLYATVRKWDDLIIYSQHFVFPNGIVGSNLRWIDPETGENHPLREGYIWHGTPSFDWSGNYLFISVAHRP